jgi:hypothetical protein
VPDACGHGDYVASIADQLPGDLGIELLRDSAVPVCWEPGICIPTGTDYEFAVTALDFFDDSVSSATDSGDPFTYVSAFNSTDSTLFSVTDAAPTTPPAVPGGQGATDPMLVKKTMPDGSTLGIFWDPDSCCGATDHHLVWGMGADLPATVGGPYGLGGSECALGTAGNFSWLGVPTPAPQDFLWWVVLANDAGTIEGSWSTDSAGNERSGPGVGGVSAECGKTSKDLANSCGQ